MASIVRSIGVLFVIAVLAYLVLLLAFVRIAYGAQAEIVYSQEYCNQVKGIHQFRINHPVTGELIGWADCATNDEIIELDFGKKWYQGVGQVLMYAQYTGLKGKLVLITKPFGRYHLRALNLIHRYNLPIEVEAIRP